jgi:hypothetical protein
MNGKRLGLAVAVATALTGGAVAYATIPDANGVIHGCYRIDGGQLRVIDAGSCKPSETALSWSQTGPRGPQGPAGVSGYQTISSDDVVVQPGTLGQAYAICPEPKVAIGGGFNETSANARVVASQAGPEAGGLLPSVWEVDAVSSNDQPAHFEASAVCVTVS